MIIDSDLLRAALVCVAKGTSADKHPQISGVHITRKHLEATNGHALVRMELTENVIDFDDDTDVDLIIRFCGDIPEQACFTDIQLGDEPKAFHLGEDEVAFSLTRLEIINGRFPDLDKSIPTEKQNVIPYFLAEYLAYPAQMFGGGAVLIEPSGMEAACRFRFGAFTNKIYGNPVFIVLPLYKDAFEAAEQRVRELEADRDR
ncbi:hypothetical protein KKI90_23075 [Xenorhabdus bovienii]|uniref:Bacteriophage protein n=3 Tax=Xenorhabdus bovienii TaxID=40576 RepID=A0AAJ1JBL7_XENBV|nr:hypothetical protein [Xenorhabdus bovienii]MDE1479767.1 hypothetical protein [Xenorhabdus bovienii]MDE1489081.1 hypothetical protein [Xenorhabdus bovienii]MDE9532906.1 hypothetical protein [Xenorhabdus bovienii]